VLAVDFAGFFTFRQFRAVGRGAKERANASAGGAHALGQIALGHQLQLDLAAAVQLVKHPAVDLAWEAADDLAHLTALEQGGQTGFTVARVVVHNRQVACAVCDQAVNEFHRVAGSAKATDEYGGAVLNTGQGLCNRVGDFVDHAFAFLRDLLQSKRLC